MRKDWISVLYWSFCLFLWVFLFYQGKPDQCSVCSLPFSVYDGVFYIVRRGSRSKRGVLLNFHAGEQFPVVGVLPVPVVMGLLLPSRAEPCRLPR